MSSIELISRAIILDGEHILLARKKAAPYNFLPGGHIEFGEPATVALARELKEELGTSLCVKEVFGVIEHAWEDDGKLNHEVNIIFYVEPGNLTAERTPVPTEHNIGFLWYRVDELETSGLEPYILRRLIPTVLKRPSGVIWGSTIIDVASSKK
jgi:ADP-ribose pyrophosphatase YjhB (NUDIX family)